MKLQSGHELVPLKGEELKKQSQDFAAYHDGLVRLTPGRWLFPTGYQKFANKIYNFKFRSSDVMIMTYPKCGTTWTQEIIWTMRNNPNFDHPSAGQHLMLRSPFIEMDMLMPAPKPGVAAPPPDPSMVEFFRNACPGRNPADGVNIQMAECTPDPRTMKTHLSLSLMPPSMLDTCKMVYVARNPKDVIVSYHHHSRILKAHDFVGDFVEFAQYFLDGDLVYGPYWLHVKEAWEKRDHPNMHFIFYEDLKANPLEEFKKLNSFLETGLSEEQLKKIVKYTSFGEMKVRATQVENFKEGGDDNKHFNMDVVKKDGGFFRKGESGNWKEKISPVLDAKVNRWIKKNMDSFGVNFKYSV